MSMAERIEKRLVEELKPERLALVNESHQHNVPGGSESHWNLIIVADAFAGQNRVARQRAVYRALRHEMQDGIHALTMKALTPEEWEAAGGEVENPAPRCMGGSKHDRS
jgi:BolA protein